MIYTKNRGSQFLFAGEKDFQRVINMSMVASLVNELKPLEQSVAMGNCNLMAHFCIPSLCDIEIFICPLQG